MVSSPSPVVVVVVSSLQVSFHVDLQPLHPVLLVHFFFVFGANNVNALIDAPDAFIALVSAASFASLLFLCCALNDPPMQAIAVVVVVQV